MVSSFKEKIYVLKLTRFSWYFLQFIVVWVNFGLVDHIHILRVMKSACILCRPLGRQSQKIPTPSSLSCSRNAGIEIHLKGLSSPRYWKFFRDSPKRSALCIFGFRHQSITCLDIVIMISFSNSKSWSLLNLPCTVWMLCSWILHCDMILTSLWNRWELTQRAARKQRLVFFQHWREVTEGHRIATATLVLDAV